MLAGGVGRTFPDVHAVGLARMSRATRFHGRWPLPTMVRRPSPDSATRSGPPARSAAGWVLLGAAVLAAALFLLFRSGSPPDAEGEGGAAAPGAGTDSRRAPGSNLPVTLVSCEESGDSVWAEGYVRNNGGVVVRYVEVEVTWRDTEGNPVDTRVTYAIGGEVFTPGDSTSFQTATGELGAVDCEASLRNYEPL